VFARISNSAFIIVFAQGRLLVEHMATMPEPKALHKMP
jgi:hypothetical protein